MALLQVNFLSSALKRTVPMTVILPVDKIFGDDRTEPDTPCFKTLYLLHGLLGNCTDWAMNTRIQQWAEAKNLAVVMPSGDNSFYVDQRIPNNDYGDFIGRELVEITRKMFPLSHKREDTYIAGLSMGGYGALRTGLLYPQVFGFAGGLSSALLTQKIESAIDENVFFRRREFLETVFGCGLDGIEKTEHDVMELSRRLLARVEAGEEALQLPRLYLACGEQDGLLPLSRELHADWEKLGIEHRYEEHEGNHEWAFWEWGLGRILEYLNE